jgi:hypothetical protein
MSARRSFVTRRRARPLLLAAMVVLAPASAPAGDVALEPFVGVQYGGAFHSESGRRAEIGIGLQYGANLDIPFEEGRWGIDLLFARQESELEDVPRLGIAIERYMVGVREEKGDGRFRFRGNFYLGATRFALAGLGSDVRFTGAIGLGASYAVSPRLGLRADARAYYAVVSFSGGTACVNGSCLYVFGGSGVWQGDVTAGLQLRF